MSNDCRIVKPGKGNTLIGENGEILHPPRGWGFLPAGDAGITRKITAKGIFWRVQIKKGKRTISKGVWAPLDIIEDAKRAVETVRSTDSYKKKLESSRISREKKQAEYEVDFFKSVKNFLSFSQCYKELEQKLAEAVTLHAVPVGSGTVARTAMIPIEERAAKAVVAWMRHKTTAYDSMVIPRIKGKRRETRRLLARRSTQILDTYRKGENIPENCPLLWAIKGIT
ncbi:MAG: DUF2293 domain-containing protein [bacterium]|nr:DUF2293 domain-containing protein [bacterium]